MSVYIYLYLSLYMAFSYTITLFTPLTLLSKRVSLRTIPLFIPPSQIPLSLSLYKTQKQPPPHFYMMLATVINAACKQAVVGGATYLLVV